MKLQVNLVKDCFNITNAERQLIGQLKLDTNGGFKNCELIIGKEKYAMIREKWKTKVIRDNSTIFHLITNSFSGNTNIVELGVKIKGVWGIKWGTQLIGKDGNSRLKISNENKMIQNGRFIIKVKEKETKAIEILLTFYIHLLASSQKRKGMLMYTIVI